MKKYYQLYDGSYSYLLVHEDMFQAISLFFEVSDCLDEIRELDISELVLPDKITVATLDEQGNVTYKPLTDSEVGDYYTEFGLAT